MQKNRNASLGPQRPRRNSIPTPEVVDMDVLGAMPDEDLFNRFRSLEDERERVIASSNDATPWEIELAYVRRELQIRRDRRSAHERYVKQLEKEYAESEAYLPIADLDNSHFLKLIGEYN